MLCLQTGVNLAFHGEPLLCLMVFVVSQMQKQCPESHRILVDLLLQPGEVSLNGSV